MTTLHSNLNDLPAEILHDIFQKASKDDLCNYALVCKSWLNSASTLLYTKVNINTLARLEKFHKSIECNNHLGFWVKKFTISIKSSTTRVNALKLVSRLLYKFLPNLEHLYIHSLYTYTPLLDALIGSKLMRLKSTNEPSQKYQSGEIANYVTCALLMKDRLEKLMISSIFEFADGKSCKRIFFDCLYYKLHQFDRLTTINIRIKSNEQIRVLEHIAENCKTLKEIKCNIYPTHCRGLFNTSFSTNALKNLTPRPNIKILINDSDNLFDEKTLIYVMHKFPQVEKFTCSRLNENSSVSPKLFSETLLKELIQYLLKLKSVYMNGFKMNEDTISEVFQNIWRTTSKFGSEEIDIYYVEPELTGGMIFITKISKQRSSIQLHYSQNLEEWNHFKFVERNGKFLKKIYLGTNQMYEDISLLVPENVMEHMAQYCPHLKDLHFEHCEFDLSPISKPVPDKIFSLDKLYLDNCKVNAIVLEQFSQRLVEVKVLTINLFDDVTTEITMPCTKIDMIILDDCVDEVILYVKLLVLTTNDHHYYQIDTSTSLAVESSEEEYEDATESRRVYVCCQTKPSFCAF